MTAENENSRDTSGRNYATTKRRPIKAAAFAARGSMVLQPPASHQEAQAEFGEIISDNAWQEICNAFERHGRRLTDLGITRYNNNKNDKQSWETRKRDAIRGIEAALEGLLKINRDFLAEAADNVSSQRPIEKTITNIELHLNRAINEVMYLSWIMREAQPVTRNIMTSAESHKQLARDVFMALKDTGARPTNGWNAEKMEHFGYNDLTGLERLVDILEIHEGKSFKAKSEWLRKALGRER